MCVCLYTCVCIYIYIYIYTHIYIYISSTDKCYFARLRYPVPLASTFLPKEASKTLQKHVPVENTLHIIYSSIPGFI